MKNGSDEIRTDFLMVKSIALTTVHLLFKNERSTAVYGYSLKKCLFLVPTVCKENTWPKPWCGPSSFFFMNVFFGLKGSLLVHSFPFVENI